MNVRNLEHYQRMMEENPGVSVGASLAASALYAADTYTGEACDVDTDYASAIRDRYGETVSAALVQRLMDSATARRRLTRVD